MNPLTIRSVLLATLALGHSAIATQPNVLFIAVDDLRPELGCYGNKVVHSPNIDRLAARGIVFNHAYCQQAVCSPSRTSLLTGRRPDATKVWDLETHFRVALPDAVTLPQYFKGNGYYCSALSKIFHHGFEDGRSWNAPHWYPTGQTVDTDPVDWTKQIIAKYGKGVNEYRDRSQPKDNDNPNSDKRVAKGKNVKGVAFEISESPDDQLPDGYTAAEAVKRLHELKEKGQPFFLATGFLKPHLPFVAPKKYWDLYDPEKIPVPTIDHLPEGCPEFAGHQNSELHAYSDVPTENPIPADYAKKLRHGYYACISYTDAQVGRLLDALDKEGLADNTIIVLWGDHGWQLGDHGLWEKHTNFEIAARAPLIISMPKSSTAGQKCEAPVEFVDVFPTLADLCGLPAPKGLDGQSLKPFIENPALAKQKVAISQYPRSASKMGLGQLMGYSIRDERYRMTVWEDRTSGKIAATELYDEKNDPAETVSLHDKPESKEIIATLSKFLPPAGSSVTQGSKSKGKPKKGKSKAAEPPAPKPEAKTTAGSEDRGPKFDRLDKEKTGKLSRDYYITHQSDPKAAAARFDNFDSNKDGFLTKEEFVTQGGKHPNAK